MTVGAQPEAARDVTRKLRFTKRIPPCQARHSNVLDAM